MTTEANSIAFIFFYSWWRERNQNREAYPCSLTVKTQAEISLSSLFHSRGIKS